MKIEGVVVFVMGVNCGLGFEFVKQVFVRGVCKVYVVVCDLVIVMLLGVVFVKFDVIDLVMVVVVVDVVCDVMLLINNVGIVWFGSLMDDGVFDVLCDYFEINVFGMFVMLWVFVGILVVYGGGVIFNILLVVSWVNWLILLGYGVLKLVVWVLINGLCYLLCEQCIQVVGLYVGFIDIDLMVGFDVLKVMLVDVVCQVYDVIEVGVEEVLIDEFMWQVKVVLLLGVYLEELVLC